MKLVLKEERHLVRGLSHIKLVLKKEQQFGEGAISSNVSLKRGTALGKGPSTQKQEQGFFAFGCTLKEGDSFHNDMLSSRGSRVFQAQLMYVNSPETPPPHHLPQRAQLQESKDLIKSIK